MSGSVAAESGRRVSGEVGAGSNESGREMKEPATAAGTPASEKDVDRKRWTKPALWAGGAVAVGFLGAIGASAWSVLQDSLPSEDPLTAYTEERNKECVAAILPETALASLPADREAYTLDWVYEQGFGEYFKSQNLNLVLQGLSDDSVVVTGLEVVDFTAAPPPDDAIHLSRCEPVGGDIPSRYFAVDMTSSPPRVTAEGGDGADAPISFPYEVSGDELERFDLTLFNNARPCTCEWRLAVHWRSAGAEGRLIVDRGGQPFRTVILTDAPLLVWYDDGELRDPYE